MEVFVASKNQIKHKHYRDDCYIKDAMANDRFHYHTKLSNSTVGCSTQFAGHMPKNGGVDSIHSSMALCINGSLNMCPHLGLFKFQMIFSNF